MIQRCVYLVVLLLALTGCTGACTKSGVEGLYELGVTGVSYALQLRADGQGTLSVSGKPVGDLRWELNTRSDQQIVELNASGPVHTALSGITPLRGGPISADVVSAGVFAPAPECTRKGRVSELVLDFDEGVAFQRTGD